MPNQNDANETQNSTTDIVNIERWERRIAEVIILTGFLMLLILTGLLIQTGIISYKSILERLNLESHVLKLVLKILVYSCIPFFL